MTELTWFPGQV